ncbi:MAG: hypothetical protein JWM14_1794, partial [Chitinophagaceae bacterium]|nr:hypothetical protein [Chitinophagaceae bacterium]
MLSYTIKSFVLIGLMLIALHGHAQRRTIKSFYPAFDSVGMKIPVELEYEVLTEDSSMKDGYWVRFSQEGDTLAFHNYLRNMLNGPQEEHFGDGHLKSKIYYKNGNRIDSAWFWEFDGHLSFIEKYKTTHTPDLIIATRINTDHKIIATGYLLKDLPDSTWTEYYPKGEKKSVASFRDGELNGWVETFYPDGHTLQKAQFKMGDLDGKVFLYYPEGNLKSECEYQRGQQNGLLIEYYNDGKIKTKSAFKNNTLNGLTQRFYPTGTLATEENYRNGVLFGFFKTYFDNGQLESQSTLDGGKKQGAYMEYNKAGVLILETGYQSGVLHGENKAYYDTGKPMHKLNYKEGIKTGKNYYYYPSGALKELHVYDTENALVKTKSYYENEQLKEEGTYSIKNNQDPNGWIKDGPWSGYHDNGKPKYKELYVLGKKNLDQLYYYPSGTLQREEHYAFNVKQLRWINYLE